MIGINGYRLDAPNFYDADQQAPQQASSSGRHRHVNVDYQMGAGGGDAGAASGRTVIVSDSNDVSDMQDLSDRTNFAVKNSTDYLSFIVLMIIGLFWG